VATTLKRGQGVTAVHQHIARIQAGLSYRAVENLQKALHIPLETMASVLGMSARDAATTERQPPRVTALQ